MTVNLSISNVSQFARVTTRATATSLPARQVATTPTNVAELSLSRYQLLRLRDALQVAMRATGAASVSSVGRTEVTSGALSLDNSVSSAVLRSREEINTATTSFSPFGPAWTRIGTSTAQVTIGGVYDSSNGAGQLRFRVSGQGGDHGQDDLRIRVRDPDNKNFAFIDMGASDPLDQVYQVGNGLTFQLGPGRLTRNDEFTVTVSDTVPSVVSTINPFDGLRNQNPNLDPGQAVGNGSLTINGTLIPISASDSISSVLDSINQSAAGVTASFDPASEGLVLTQNTPGAAASIDIQADPSGFAAATKLAGATVTPGKDPDLSSPLNAVGQFGSVQSGAISVNGTSIPIDIGSDSLADVLQRISSADGVTASFTEDPQRVLLASARPISLDDGGTGLLAALNISSKSYRGAAGNRVSASRAAAIQGTVRNVANLLNGFLSIGRSGSSASSLREQLAGIVSDFVPADRGTRSGVRFTGGAAARLDTSAVGRSLGREASETLAFLNGSDTGGGFLQAVAISVDQAITALNQQLGLRGTTIDQFV